MMFLTYHIVDVAVCGVYFLLYSLALTRVDVFFFFFFFFF